VALDYAHTLPVVRTGYSRLALWSPSAAANSRKAKPKRPVSRLVMA